MRELLPDGGTESANYVVEGEAGLGNGATGGGG